MSKLEWEGTVIGVQPRIRLTRSFDERYHTYLGYSLRIRGQIDGEPGEFLIGIGKAAQTKHQFRVGDTVSGRSVPAANPKLEPADYYKTAALKLSKRTSDSEHNPPPWHDSPPELEIYRERGHRHLSTRTYKTKCLDCLWGCQMAVEIIVDHWNPRQKRYRTETFCYGPKSCGFYKAGPIRKVPGRKGMVWEEADWVDEDATAHRAMDE
ncbi:MAG TPA: hypothetical protein EYP90_05790 [Chromatiaceae bacterium]|nr:hypothetical protein [Chromatiaceae bacterium]